MLLPLLMIFLITFVTFCHFYILEILSDSDADFSNLFLGNDASGNILFDNPSTDQANAFQDVSGISLQTNNVANNKYQYNARYSASDSSMAEEGSPGSFIYGSPSGSNGSLDSGIRSADLSSPDSPLTPFDGSANLSFPYVDGNSLNLAAMQMNLAPMNIQKDATVNPQTESILIKQLAQDVAQLKQEQMEKQQLQQQQHIFQQQLLLFLQQQKMLQEGNISQPPQQPAPRLTQQSTPQLTRQPPPQLTQPVTLTTLQQSGDLASQKDSQIRKILLMTKSNIDKTKNKIQDTFQETKSKLNKLPKPYKVSGKRKQGTEREVKGIKVSKSDELLNSSPASNSVQVQGSSVVSFLFLIGLMN